MEDVDLNSKLMLSNKIKLLLSFFFTCQDEQSLANRCREKSEPRCTLGGCILRLTKGCYFVTQIDRGPPSAFPSFFFALLIRF